MCFKCQGAILCMQAIIRYGRGDGEVEEEDEGKAEAEFEMLGFMMPEFHAEKGTEAAAKEGNGDETGFRDTPFVMTRFPFINTIEEESNKVNCCKIDQKAIWEG